MSILNDKNTIYKKVDGHSVDDIEGIAMWYINHAPQELDMSTAFGYKPDFNGVGVFTFKHENRWRMMSIYNQGLQGLSIETAVNNLSKFRPFLFSFLYRLQLTLTTLVS